MARITKIEDFKAWTKARELNTFIQEIILRNEFNSFPDLRSQMQRNSRSVMANLAEGFSRKGNAEFINFISISVGSLMELKSDWYACHDLKIITKELFDQILLLIDEVGKLANGMSRYLRKSPYLGTKFIKRWKN